MLILVLLYNYLDFICMVTVKNAVETRREIYTEYESDNLRKYLLSAGYVFGDKHRVLWEPSFLLQYVDKTKEKRCKYKGIKCRF
jgi:hypothetical protein